MGFLSSILPLSGGGPAEPPPYSVYTRDFDRTVEASQLDDIIGPLPRKHRKAHEEAWDAFSNALEGWRTKANLLALESSGRIRAALDDEDRADTIITLLIDQSGSMRGQKMLMAAATADVSQQFVALLGCKVEVLGFTTSSWRGGFSRQRWNRRFRPRNPGRLCDLLHIVYRWSGNARASTGSWDFKPMLRPDLPKENVDGEAIEWAAMRLRAHPEHRKILLVLSDGAPVDDSTLAANDLGILRRHLVDVIAEIEENGDIEIAAIGIEHEIEDFYPTSATVNTPNDLGPATIEMIERMLIGKKEKAVAESVSNQPRQRR